MIFMSYWFFTFAAVFFAAYWLVASATIRRLLILLSGAVFQIHFAGAAGIMPILILGVVTYFAGTSNNQLFQRFAITLCVVALVFYKYTLFLSSELIGLIDEQAAQNAVSYFKTSILPATPPLAISFFVFEFVHYLTDVMRGEKPMRSVQNFALFTLFWPSMVAGPIKRYEPFIPELEEGCRNLHSQDVMLGMLRVSIGLIKKFIADNLTAMLALYTEQYDTLNAGSRWLVVIGIALRILFDFSGYSDIAIGFARMMGIRLLENFNWPYLATSPIEFWRRWHMSLSSWIRDYVYIPLGGSRHGLMRKVFNGVFAFALCGLWHGAGWNFLIWGVYHGVGLAVNNLWNDFNQKRLPNHAIKKSPISIALSWAGTMLFVMVGWLLFFFPVPQAWHMLTLLVIP